MHFLYVALHFVAQVLEMALVHHVVHSHKGADSEVDIPLVQTKICVNETCSDNY